MGGLTFGLTMRYLGIALGMAVALGYTAIFGTLVPPLFHGTLGQTVGRRFRQVCPAGRRWRACLVSRSAVWRAYPRSEN